MMLFGPQCFDSAGNLTCTDAGLADISQISIVSQPDGHRDPINPVTRTISMLFQRPFKLAPVYYDVHVPNMLQVASPRRELIDINPTVDGTKLKASLQLRAQTPPNPVTFPDYNLYY